MKRLAIQLLVLASILVSLLLLNGCDSAAESITQPVQEAMEEPVEAAIDR